MHEPPTLATLAFTACFYASSLLGPPSPVLQKAIGLSDFQTAVVVAVPVLLGSVMRVPLGVLTNHYAARSARARREPAPWLRGTPADPIALGARRLVPWTWICAASPTRI